MTQVDAVTALPPELSARPAEIGLVSIVLPHFNDYDNLAACLDLLDAQTFPRDRMEIIVADNGSSRGVEAVRAIVGSRGRVIEVADRGAGPARNGGVAASRGDALAFIDSDCRPDPRWLEEGLSELKRADFVGGRVDVLVEDPARMTAAEAFESVFAFHNDRYVEDRKFTVTASMFVWRSVFDRVGGFKNGVPEDIEWCRRATQAGLRIHYAPKSIVGHPARRTLGELKRKWRRLTLEWCEDRRQRGKGPAFMLLYSWAALFAVAPRSFGVLASNRIGGLESRFKAVGALAYVWGYRVALTHRIVLGLREKP